MSLCGTEPSPASREKIGAATASRIMSDDAGLPGSPITGLPSTIANTVGLPGFTRKPCTITPGFPIASITRGVRSRTPTDEPPVSTTASAAANASRTARSSSSGVSIATGRCTGTQPSAISEPASAQRFESRT